MRIARSCLMSKIAKIKIIKIVLEAHTKSGKVLETKTKPMLVTTALMEHSKARSNNLALATSMTSVVLELTHQNLTSVKTLDIQHST